MSKSAHKAGSVYNNYSNLVLGVAVDASAMHVWKGYDHPGYEELTNAMFDGDDITIDLEGTSAVLFDMGGCGSSDVFRLGDDDIALVEHYSADWNPQIEAQFLDVVRRPIGDEPHRIGTVEVKSGVLALLHAGDPGPAQVPALAPGSAEQVECHVLLAVPNGRYFVIGEMIEAKGGWGTIETRVRIVREDSLAKAGTPTAITEVQKPALPDIVKHVGQLELPGDMQAVASMALARQPWLVVGEKSGSTIATWNVSSGKLAWHEELAPRATEHIYAQSVHVSIAGDRIAAAVGDKLVILALADGKILHEHSLGPGKTGFARMIGSSSSFVRFAPDGKHVLVGQLPDVLVLDAETGAARATLHECSGTCDAFVSPDGATIALPGAKLQLVDARSFAVQRTFELDGYATAAAFSPRGDVLAIARGGVVGFHDVKTGAASGALPAASDLREISVNEIAWSSTDLIATASEDGYVRLWNGKTHELVGNLAGHDTTTPGTGARGLRGLAFSPDGKVLFVGAGPAGTRALSAYLLR